MLLGKKYIRDDSRLMGTILAHLLVSTVGECLSPLFRFVIVGFFTPSTSESTKRWFFQAPFWRGNSLIYFFWGGGGWRVVGVQLILRCISSWEKKNIVCSSVRCAIAPLIPHLSPQWKEHLPFKSITSTKASFQTNSTKNFKQWHFKPSCCSTEVLLFFRSAARINIYSLVKNHFLKPSWHRKPLPSISTHSSEQCNLHSTIFSLETGCTGFLNSN